MNELDVYIYGMSLLSTIHQLDGKFPARDTYEEIRDTYIIAGGEGANAAIVLSNLGVNCVLDGCYFGEGTEKPLREYFQKKHVDCSPITLHSGFDGWRDIVFCDGESRTVFGWFVENLFGGKRLWTIPSEEYIKHAKCVALDPFFGSESLLAAEICKKYNKAYVTIDCHHDSKITCNARAVGYIFKPS
jgi:sugar/nucleoside kinase (ribokinase family)